MAERQQQSETERPKTSKLATACFAMSLGVPFAGILCGLSPVGIAPLMKWALSLVGWPVLAFFRLIVLALWQAVPVLGAIALIKVGKRPTRLRGGRLAKAGLCIWVTINILWILLRVQHVLHVGTMYRNVGKVAALSNRVVCGSNLSSLMKAVVAYANDQEPPSFPVGDKWRDLLIEHNFSTTTQFVCRGSDAAEGECSYAINKHVAGKDISKLPPDVVVFFETNSGKHPRGRQGALKDRECYRFMPRGKPETKVYKLRWNQVGGPELLTTENHEGEGCNVVYASLREEFVRTQELGKLRWRPDE